ncbi:MAG: triose-phosphate isomerase [Sulfolobales archaeon]|nr:triose-phosphate isomerase [Sulfolobales archaeon]MCX8208695.1 triose-phosphate isomerase [Sulfolobales archaeon]MDW8010282.1 triose-phosphate isomerase [Sulfolobales archaeon]
MIRELKAPLLVINFKVYDSSIGRRALAVGRAAEKVHLEFKNSATVVVAPPATELRTLSESLELPVFAQHADPVALGAYTGAIPLEAVKEAGAAGFIANHSERRIRLDEISFLIEKSRRLELVSLVCASKPIEAAAVSTLEPDIVAIEPPELIGTGLAVSRVKPEVVTSSVALVRRYNKDVTILTGAGISSAEDAEAAILLGTSGVLVSSAVMKAQDPEKVVRSMVEAMLKATEKLGSSRA